MNLKRFANESHKTLILIQTLAEAARVAQLAHQVRPDDEICLRVAVACAFIQGFDLGYENAVSDQVIH